jgi:hypothetical protein
MKSHTVLIIASALALAGAAPSSAQQQTPYVVGSTVTGHVYCSDTNAPARFAKVLLKSTAPSHAGDDFIKSLTSTMEKAMAKDDDQPSTRPSQSAATLKSPNPKPMTDTQKRAMAAATKGMDQTMDMLNSSTVGLSGEYSFSGVKPGTYYVHAIYPGYVDPYGQLSDDDFTSTDPDALARVARLPTVTVTGTDSARLDLHLDRGGAISGTLLYDDGNPASGWTLSVIKPKSPEDPGEATAAAMGQALAMMGATPPVKSDDLGHFRISGLPPGDYALKASLLATGVGISATNMGEGGSGIVLAAYSGNTFTRDDAKSIHVIPGQEQPGEDITIPARKLRNISGHAYAKSDGHALNVGIVTLTRKDNPAVNLSAAIRDDGSFRFEYLPAATYTLTLAGAADGSNANAKPVGLIGMNIPNPDILRKYAIATTDIILGDSDVDTVAFTVAQIDWTPPAKKPGSPGVTPGDLLNGILGAASGSDDSGNSGEKP